MKLSFGISVADFLSLRDSLFVDYTCSSVTDNGFTLLFPAGDCVFTYFMGTLFVDFPSGELLTVAHFLKPFIV